MARPASPFQYALGQAVHWAHGATAAQPFVIEWRRVTEGQVSTWVEYLLTPRRTPKGPGVWAYEADLEAVADRRTA